MFLALNIVLHIAVLYAFISSFFILYVSRIERDAFKSEFGNIVNENLTQALENANAASGGQFKTVIQGLEPVLQVMANIYSKPTPEIQTYNKALFTSSYMVLFIIFFTFVLLVGVLKYSCHVCMPLGHIIKENLIVFAVIGITEFWFFDKIGSQFVPVKPSLLITTLINRLKSNLSASR